ncbi:MBL fold metallo-hydrolase [Streptococcus sp. zg-JUN1979]|uniref:MBL fold metallo-hydrolase n=1 Tax=Streptococcus sp. zg-JUN1979 TaxID=3391450 RepID=UPI0039A507C2
MIIKQTLNAIAYENTYYLVNDQAVLVIDPGSDTETIIETLKAIHKPVAAILLTHTHYDHIMSVDELRRTFNHPPVYVSKEERTWLGSPVDNLSGLPRHDDMADVIIQDADEYFTIGQDYHLSGFDFSVRKTPGHSIGGVSFVFPKDEVVFSGDTLFNNSIGRVDLPTGDLETLLSSIKTELFTLPNHYKVYPGHGKQTTIGHEKHFNPFFIS